MSPRILVIDDEPVVRSALERTLRHFGFDVITAADGDSAYALLTDTGFDAVLLDVLMPQISGDTLYLAFVRRWPELRERIVLMSGDPQGVSVNWPDELKRRPILAKPFNIQDVRRVIADVLASHQDPPLRRNSQG
ncbi:MAG: response regulator [Gemmatimonadales bacterium]